MKEANSKSYEIDSVRYQAVIIWGKLQRYIAFDLTELSRIHNNRTFLKILLNPTNIYFFTYLFVFPGLVTLSILHTEKLHNYRNITS